MTEPKPELVNCYSCRRFHPKAECSQVRHGDTDHWVCKLCAEVHRRRAAR